MTPDRWKQIDDLLEAVLDLEPDRRSAFLDHACAGDEDLRRVIDRLLISDARAETFIESPPSVVAADLVDRKLPVSDAPRLAHYEVLSLLGVGGMGEVYVAYDLRLRRKTALKLLPAEVGNDAARVRRFEREARAAANLAHPNVCVVYDVGRTDDGRPFIAMEYVEGETLRDRIGRGTIDLAEALEIASQIAAALAAAHAAGVVHRDIKPENVILRPDGYAKVLDFGIAKLLEPLRSTASIDASIAVQSSETESGALGTVNYMSPEQARGRRVDGRSDIFSLGVTLFEMLAGERPFVRASPLQTLAAIVDHAAPIVSTLRPGLPDAIDRVVARCLEKNPTDRYATSAELAETLRDLGETLRPRLDRTQTARLSELDDACTNNLPESLTRFVGRDADIADLTTRFETERLVTIVGPGGMGKTRLGLEVASRLVPRYADGVWMVELAACVDPTLVPRMVATTLGVRDDGREPVSSSLARWLANRRVLVLLDNCEHLVDACARLAAELLRSAAHVHVLATSREPLAIAGEVVWSVPPLTLPGRGARLTAAEIPAFEATHLFVERAVLASRAFAVSDDDADSIAEICRHLDGMPLAIELAAARTRSLTVSQIVERLGRRFELLVGGGRAGPSRQQTLRATLDWSINLLDDSDRELFRRLSVFAGGWTLGAAERVCADDVMDPVDTLDGLQRLIDRSLVIVSDRSHEARYGMLETIREYAREQLDASGERTDIERRHAAEYLALACSADLELEGPNAALWVERLEADHDNLRIALAWWLQIDAEVCLRLASAIRIFWSLRGHYAEGRRWLEAALSRAVGVAASDRAIALRRAGILAREQGDLEAARSSYDESVRTARAAGDLRQVARSSKCLATLAVQQSDLAAARAYLTESLAAADTVGDDSVAASSLNSLGVVHETEGDLDSARELYERALGLYRTLGDQGGVSVGLGNLGGIAYRRGDVAAADAFYREAIDLGRRLGFASGIACSLDGFGALATSREAWARAARLAGAAEALRETIGYELEVTEREFCERYVGAAREKLGETLFETALANGRAMGVERAVAYALEESRTAE